MPSQLADARLEIKFNPYYDPANGQFTFAPGGGGAGAAGMSRPPRRPPLRPGQEDPRMLAIERQVQAKIKAADPRNPANFAVYKVKPGDTLQHIAAMRVDVTPADLQWLNDLPSDRIRTGQQLRVPNQAFLDDGKHAFDTYVALQTYMERHNGRLPTNVAHPPSLDEQNFGPGTHVVQRNGYDFTLDTAHRARKIAGTITLASNQRRSRPAQLAAGGVDQLPTDHGGHYIARRFNGPTDGFNQSAYAKLENQWEKAAKRGEKVHVTITPIYPLGSQRPSSIHVTYRIGGRIVTRDLPKSRNSRYDR